ncbi:MAG: ribonuclease J [Magnetococcales bacterium]|nr:ribonuclease J [Magnetococcales bacterium]
MSNQQASDKKFIDIVPLGGLGEIGMNLMVYEFNDKLLIVDCGITFPTAETPGVDQIIPDFRYLLENRERVVGYVITHGHEDHIGAMPQIWPQVPAPIYGTGMSIGLLKGKFREHRLLGKAVFTEMRYRQKFQVGPFNIEPMQVTHSIVDAAALAITTPIGTVIHTGDFNIDHTPINNRPTDLFSLARYGEQGVLALLSDSTNVDKTGRTISEQVVGKELQRLFAKAEKLIITAAFSSNIERTQQVINAAVAVGRQVAPSGRSMLNNLQIAQSLGHLKVPENTLVDIKQFKKIRRDKLVILSTGSQGEPNSSLTRITAGDHKTIRIQKGDMVVFSSKFIPGNERTIWTLINKLFALGADVYHEKNRKGIHVSGHAPQDDLKLMLALTKPNYFIPIHGEMHHLNLHRKLATSMGVPESNSLVMENGDRVRLDSEGVRVIDHVHHGRILLDGKGIEGVDDIALRDRRQISESGLAVVVIAVDKKTGKLKNRPELMTRGIVYEEENQDLLDEALDAVEHSFTLGPKGMDFREEDEAGLPELAVRGLRRFFKRKLGRRPVVIPLVMEI